MRRMALAGFSESSLMEVNQSASGGSASISSAISSRAYSTPIASEPATQSSSAWPSFSRLTESASWESGRDIRPALIHSDSCEPGVATPTTSAWPVAGRAPGSHCTPRAPRAFWSAARPCAAGGASVPSTCRRTAWPCASPVNIKAMTKNRKHSLMASTASLNEFDLAVCASRALRLSSNDNPPG